ncbi:MAG: phosphoribosylglycinamide formyltransferase [Pyrinomonadaceae bacterium]
MNIGILISGRGSNMLAISEAVSSGRIPNSRISVVISDQPGATGIKHANELGIETQIIARNGRTRKEHDREICSVLRQHEVQLVCLAGYMRLLSKDLINAFPKQILNIHPSLLPSFKGLNAQQQAIDYGVKITGCTVHFVDEKLDHGAIILQESIDVLNDDTSESLSERLILREHICYVEAIRRFVSGEIRVEGRLVENVSPVELSAGSSNSF